MQGAQLQVGAAVEASLQTRNGVIASKSIKLRMATTNSHTIRPKTPTTSTSRKSSPPTSPARDIKATKRNSKIKWLPFQPQHPVFRPFSPNSIFNNQWLRQISCNRACFSAILTCWWLLSTGIARNVPNLLKSLSNWIEKWPNGPWKNCRGEEVSCILRSIRMRSSHLGRQRLRRRGRLRFIAV